MDAVFSKSKSKSKKTAKRQLPIIRLLKSEHLILHAFTLPGNLPG
jgi:hypothetical protein